MKVFVLYYTYYEDSAIRGIYTEEAMMQKKIEFGKRQKEFNEELLKAHISTLETKQKEKKELINKMDADLLDKQKAAKEAGNSEFEKIYKKERKDLRKKIDAIQSTVLDLKRRIEEVQESNMDKLAYKYMLNNHLSFEEHYIIEYVHEGDYYTDIYSNE